MAGKTAILTLKILGDAKDAQKALDETSSSAGKFQSGVKSAAVPAAAALAGLAAAGMTAAQAAAEDAAAADQLALALRKSAGASDKSIANTEDWITKTSKAAAVADDELRPALGTLVRATGDVGESQDAMAVALDVSAATGKDVESVSTALAKAYGGQTAGLKKLVPGMDDAVLASGDMDAIMAELSRTMGGASAEAANSAAGQMEGMKIQMGEAQEAIGGALLPAMTSLSGILAEVAAWVQENSRLFLIIGGAIAGVAASILVLNVAFKAYAVLTKAVSAATKVWTAIQWLLNASFWSNPVFLIIAGVLLLIGAIVLIATKTTWFQDIWNAAWTFIKEAAAAVWEWLQGAAVASIEFVAGLWTVIADAAQAVWDWIIDVIKRVLQGIASLVVFYINIYIAIWQGIKAGVGAVWDWIVGIARSALDLVKRIVQAGMDFVVSVFEGIKSAVGAVWQWLQEAAQKALDAILAPVNLLKQGIDKIIGAIQSLIDWLGRIKMPAAVQNIADTIGGILPFSAASTSTGTTTFTAAPTFRAGTRAAQSSSRGVNITVNVPESSDPVATARYIKAILRRGEAAGVIFGAAV